MPKKRVNPEEYNFQNKELESGNTTLKPKAKGNIPKLAVLLGLLSPFYYDLYKKCDGETTIDELSGLFDIDLDSTRIYIDKLQKNGLIKF